MNHNSTKKAFSLTELLITSAILIVLFTTSLTGFVLLKQIFAENNAKATFQRGAAVIMNKITEWKAASGGIRLSEAAIVETFVNNTSVIKFIGTDGIHRMYYPSVDNASLLYDEENGVSGKIIYTVPRGAVLGLRFSPVNADAVTLCVNVYVSISQVINGRTVLSALESSVYLKNHPLLHE